MVGCRLVGVRQFRLPAWLTDSLGLAAALDGAATSQSGCAFGPLDCLNSLKSSKLAHFVRESWPTCKSEKRERPLSGGPQPTSRPIELVVRFDCRARSEKSQTSKFEFSFFLLLSGKSFALFVL